MKFKLIIFIFSFIFISLSYGNSSKKSEYLNEILELMNFKETIIDGARQAMISNALKDNQVLSDSMKNMIELSIETLSELLKDDVLLQNKIINLYDEYFSESELKDYISFLKSKAGQKMMRHQVDILMETNRISQEWFQGIQSNMFEKIKMKIIEKNKEKK